MEQNQKLTLISVGDNIIQNFLEDSLAGFSQTYNKKSLPFWWLYDEIGSHIFEGKFFIKKAFF